MLVQLWQGRGPTQGAIPLVCAKLRLYSARRVFVETHLSPRLKGRCPRSTQALGGLDEDGCSVASVSLDESRAESAINQVEHAFHFNVEKPVQGQ